jgi:hypothetical protein
MSASEKPKWKQFEEFVKEVQEHLAPDAKVTTNERIMGASGKQRQIDVVVRKTVGQFSLLIAIDCKDWKTKVDIQDVEMFVGMVEDVKANKGALVCNSGFTDGAKSIATMKGISLFSAIDVQSIDWPAFAAIPALVRLRSLQKFSLSFSYNGLSSFSPPTGSIPLLEVFDAEGKSQGVVGRLIYAAWNSGIVPPTPGHHKGVKFLPKPAYYRVGDKIIGPVEILGNIHVEEKIYLGNWPLEEAKGFRDEVTGEFSTRSFTTSGLQISDVINTWTQIANESDLAVKPLIAFTATGAYEA